MTTSPGTPTFRMIEAARELARDVGSKLEFKVERPQSERDLAALEAVHGIRLPEDYRDFVLRYGLLSISFGGTYRGDYAPMMPLEQAATLARDFDGHMVMSAGDPTALIPFQFTVDPESLSFYHFTVEELTREVSMKRLASTVNYKLLARDSFFEHVRHLLAFVLSWQAHLDEDEVNQTLLEASRDRT